MTEDEAKTKTCHKTLLPTVPAEFLTTSTVPTSPYEHTFHRTGPQPKTCLGSQCMAWRWAKATKEVPGDDMRKEAEQDGYRAVGYEVVAFDVTYKMEKRLDSGFCGLAGKP